MNCHKFSTYGRELSWKAVSERNRWSEACNPAFRSAYFRLGHLIQERVPCKVVLALTATATKTTQQSIREVLKIPQESTIRDSELPPNLRLAVQDVKAGASPSTIHPTRKTLTKSRPPK